MKSLPKIICLLFVLGMLSSCAIKYLPVSAEGVTIADDYGIIDRKDFVFAVANKYWVKEPQNLTDFFTTFYISYKNKTEKKIAIKPNDIGLLDSSGNQFDAVSIDYVLDLLVPKEITFENSFDIPENQRQIWEDWRDAKNHLMADSFHFGSILPGAKKSGFVFFPKLRSENRTCKIIFQETGIEFVREK